MGNWLIAILLVLWAVPAWATQYTVAKTGTDAASCVTNPPTTDCLTIQYVLDNVDMAGGDILEVEAGTYEETVTWGLNDDGADGSPIIFRGKSGDTVTIDGGTNSLVIRRTQWLDVQNLTITGATGHCVIVQSTVVGQDTHDVNFTDVTIHDCGSTGLYQTGDAWNKKVYDNTHTRVTSYNNGANGFMCYGMCENIRYYNCTAYSNGANNHNFSSGAGSTSVTTGWVNVAGNIYKRDITVDGHDSGTPVYLMNDFTGTKYTMDENDGNFATLAAGEWDLNGDELHINVGEDPEGQTIKYTTTRNIYIKYYDCISHSNTDGGTEGHGFQFDDWTEHGLVERCLSYNNGGHGFQSNVARYPVFKYSIAYGNSNGGFRVNGGHKIASLYNNVAYNNEDGLSDSVFDSTDYSIIKNNIFYDNTQYGIDYNAVENASTDNKTNIVYANDVAATNNFTLDTTDITSDPLFIDAANGDFRLQANSPAIDAGAR